MFKHANNTVSQGSVGLAGAMFYYRQAGFNVLLPLSDNQSYDLVIEKNNVFYTVQAKTTSFKKNGNYIVQLKKVRPNRTRNKIEPIDKVDFVFVLCDNGDMYSVPFADLTSLLELRVSKQQKNKVN